MFFFLSCCSIIYFRIPLCFIDFFPGSVFTFKFHNSAETVNFSCRPLFSCSLLSIVRTLLEQTREEEVQILGCNTLVDFISLQVHLAFFEAWLHVSLQTSCPASTTDGNTSFNIQTVNSHMFNLEGLIPKLCQLAQEMGDDERSLRLRSAGMQALAFMVMLYLFTFSFG